MTRVSVLIPTVGRSSVRATLAALAAQRRPPEFEVVVSVDGPAALDLDDVRTPRLRVVRSAARHGVSAARNAAIALADGRLLAFLDDDVVPDPDWVEAVARNLDSADAVTGRIIEDDRSGTLARLRRFAFDHRHRTNTARVDYLNGGNCAMTRDALARVGGFDTSYPKSQDRELAGRLVRAGFTIGYAPDMVVAHRASYTMRGLVEGRFRAGEAAARMSGGSAGPTTLKATYGANLLVLARRHGVRVAAAAFVSAAAHRLGRHRGKERATGTVVGVWKGGHNVSEQRTHIAVVLDRSGSMHTIREDAEGGLKAFLADQAAVPGRATVSLYQFDHEYEAVYEGRDVRELPDFRLTPRGNTALLDAVGRTVAQVDSEVAKATPDHVVIVVVTDGQENSSREFTLAQCRELIEARQRAGWKFVFLAADATAFSEGAAMAMPAAMSMSSGKRDLAKSMRVAGKMVARGRQGGEYEFTDEERIEGGDNRSAT